MKETYQRPTWDEYFLDVMHALARRATCDRGRTACVVVKDKQIIVSGYVGSPPGLPHCDEVGHLMKKVVEEDGSIHEHCMLNKMRFVRQQKEVFLWMAPLFIVS